MFRELRQKTDAHCHRTGGYIIYVENAELILLPSHSPFPCTLTSVNERATKVQTTVSFIVKRTLVQHSDDTSLRTVQSCSLFSARSATDGDT